MKVLITEVCTGKPDGVHEIVYTDGREYDLPEGLAKKFMGEGKATHPHLNPLPEGEEILLSPPFQGEDQGGNGLKVKSKKEVRHVKE